MRTVHISSLIVMVRQPVIRVKYEPTYAADVTVARIKIATNIGAAADGRGVVIEDLR